jgi:hypothetical protein
MVYVSGIERIINIPVVKPGIAPMVIPKNVPSAVKKKGHGVTVIEAYPAASCRASSPRGILSIF